MVYSKSGTALDLALLYCQRVRPSMWLALAINVAATIYLGIFPQSVLDFATRAAEIMTKTR